MKRLILGTAAVLLSSATAAWPAVEISTAPTSNMVCAAGVCAPSAKSAVLNANDLAAMLAAADVKVVTGSSAVTITVVSPFSWTSASRLTLDANLNVSFKAPVVVAGPGAVTIVTDDGGTGGDLIFFDGSKLDFWDTSSSLIVNGDSYTLAPDVPALADAIAAHETGHFALAGDYDASQAGTYHLGPPITLLRGALEGLGHTISNLTIKVRGCRYATNLGLIGTIDDNGAVRDLHLDRAVVTSVDPHFVGILAGVNRGAISNVTVGGLAHTASGGGSSCPVEGAVGGLVGISNSSGAQIVNARSSASVSASYVEKDWPAYVGGLVGSGNNIDRSSATGPVTGNRASYVGGLAGLGSFITRSFATGSVAIEAIGNGTGAMGGGLIGAGGPVADSYATGSVEVGNCDGGLTGTGGPMTTSYSTGPSTGGLVGCEEGGPSANSYWDIDTSGTAEGCQSGDCTGITGLSDAQMKSLPAGFDRTVWGRKKSINNGYPYLIANPPQ